MIMNSNTFCIARTLSGRSVVFRICVIVWQAFVEVKTRILYFIDLEH